MADFVNWNPIGHGTTKYYPTLNAGGLYDSMKANASNAYNNLPGFLNKPTQAQIQAFNRSVTGGKSMQDAPVTRGVVAPNLTAADVTPLSSSPVVGDSVGPTIASAKKLGGSNSSYRKSPSAVKTDSPEQMTGILNPQSNNGLFTSLNGNKGKMNFDGSASISSSDNGSTYLSPEYFDNGGSNYYNNTSFMERLGNDGLGSAFGGGLSNIGDGISNWWGGLDSGGKMGAVTGGTSALANLWNSYNQQKYADKAAKLQDRAQSFYEQQLNRQNQRQDLAQSHYDASFR